MKSNKFNTGPTLAFVTAAAMLGAAALAPESTLQANAEEKSVQLAAAQLKAQAYEEAIKAESTLKDVKMLPGTVVFRDNKHNKLGSAYSPIVLSEGNGALKVSTSNINSALNGTLLGLQTKDSNGKMHVMLAEYNEVFTSFEPADKNNLKPVTADLKSTNIGDSVNPQYILNPVEGTYPSNTVFPGGTVGQFILDFEQTVSAAPLDTNYATIEP